MNIGGERFGHCRQGVLEFWHLLSTVVGSALMSFLLSLAQCNNISNMAAFFSYNSDKINTLPPPLQTQSRLSSPSSQTLFSHPFHDTVDNPPNLNPIPRTSHPPLPCFPAKRGKKPLTATGMEIHVRETSSVLIGRQKMRSPTSSSPPPPIPAFNGDLLRAAAAQCCLQLQVGCVNSLPVNDASWLGFFIMEAWLGVVEPVYLNELIFFGGGRRWVGGRASVGTRRDDAGHKTLAQIA